MAGLAEIPGIVRNSPADAMPDVCNFSVENIKSETMLHYLEARDIYVSSGSACSKGEASHTLQAMGLPLRPGRYCGARLLLRGKYPPKTWTPCWRPCAAASRKLRKSDGEEDSDERDYSGQSG